MSRLGMLIAAGITSLVAVGLQPAAPGFAAAGLEVVGQPAMATSANGTTTVAYADGVHGMHVRQYDGGRYVRDLVVGSAADGLPTVGVDSRGDAVIAWRDGGGIVVRRVDAATGVVTAAAWQPPEGSHPRVSVAASGASVLTWQDAAGHVEIAGFTSDGGVAYPVVQVDSAGDASDPALGIDATGGAAVAWQQDGHIALARVSVSGVVTRAAANADDGSGSMDTRAPVVGSLANGDFVVAWAAQFGDGWRIQARGFTAGLGSRFAEVDANSSPVPADSSPLLGTDDTGGFVLAWRGDAGARVRGFNSNGTTASRYPLTVLPRAFRTIAVGVDTYDASFAMATTTAGGSLQVRFGLHNLTQPGATVTAPLSTVTPIQATMTFDGSDLATVTSAETANPQLAPHPLADVLASANSTARPLCHDTHSTPPATGFCWDDTYGDDSSYAYVPQGFTQLRVDGRRLLVTSWYSTYDNPSGTNYVRITFVDITDPAHITYRHVLAVDPTGDSTVFAPERGHADAIVASGHYLLLASNGDAFDVFDLNHLWKMNASLGAVGRQADGTFSASWHLWAMPRVGRFAYPTSGCGTYFDELPCITAASLDTSTNPATLVTTEGGLFNGPQDFTEQSADIVRWPINPATALPAASPDGLVHASARLRTHVPSIQGGTSYHGGYVFAGPCPEFVPGMYNIPSCLYTASPDQPTRLWTRGGINLENVFYDPPTDQLWTLSESPRSRVVYHLPLHGRNRAP